MGFALSLAVCACEMCFARTNLIKCEKHSSYLLIVIFLVFVFVCAAIMFNRNQESEGQTTDLWIIIAVFSALLGAMTSVFLFNCIRTLIRDQKIIRVSWLSGCCGLRTILFVTTNAYIKYCVLIFQSIENMKWSGRKFASICR